MKSLVRWDPFRMVRRWEPFDELRIMQNDLENLFERMLGTSIMPTKGREWLPHIESFTKNSQLVFRAELPGVDPKDLDVSITDRELIIKGERKQEKDTKEENYVYREISYGSFERHFALPEGVKADELRANFKNGILEISVPAPMVQKSRKIEVEVATEEKKALGGEEKKAA